MSDILIRASIPSDAHWSYDDPAGMPEPLLEVSVPETLRGDVERAAARDGLTPREWLLASRHARSLCADDPEGGLEMAEHRFHTPAPVDLDLEIPVGEIQVETIDGDESFVSVTGNEKLVEHTEVRLDGNRLVVALKGKKPFGITISIGDFSFGTNGLNVAVADPPLERRVARDRVGRHEAERPLQDGRGEVRVRRCRGHRRDRGRRHGQVRQR